QTPLFVSFFLALQGMAAAPVPGLLRGGLGWFPNLAAPDPFYILPVLVTASTWLVLELGAETGVAAPGAGPVRQILRLLPLLFLPFIVHFPTRGVATSKRAWPPKNGRGLFNPPLKSPKFPKIFPFLTQNSQIFFPLPVFPRGHAPPGPSSMLIGRRFQAVFTYWLTSNSFSLLQTGLLRVPALRAKLGVAPPLATPPATPPGHAPQSKGGIFRQLKKEWREAQATHEAEQRRWRLKNHLNLAAKGPLRQTFAQNPLSSPGATPGPPSETPKRPWKETLG
ncbi:OXA1L protein, partial [Cettia cetti]|nr:OXA1L protein [Cettia cetti]